MAHPRTPTNAPTPTCDRVLEELASLADDQLDASLREHVAGCDYCRDLRHEARELTRAVSAGGVDYQHPADFEARVLAALDARPPVEPARTTQPGFAAEPSASGASARSNASEAREENPAEKRVGATPPSTSSAASTSTSASTAAKREENHTNRDDGPARGRRSVRWPAYVVGTALAVAAAFPIALALRNRTTPSNSETPPVASSTARVVDPNAVRTPWQGVVAEVARAAADRNGGLEVRAPGARDFAPLANGGTVAAGSEVRTDGRTRARIELSDGTKLVLDRGTHLRFDANNPRTAELRSGSLVADVAHIDAAPTARFATPGGAVTVLGTKFALTAADARQSTVRVTRGTVRLSDSSGREAEVKTGFEGTVAEGRAPSVAPAVGLARAVSWSELGEQTRVEPDAPVVGLGELRARRPGQTDERDHAVRLAAHSVRVRIAGNQARTEIDETFANETDHALEGIYRFPLPPQAQVEKLALDVNGQMEDGAFVDRTRAAAIWRGVLRNALRPMQQQVQTDELVWVPGPWRDPALLEWQRGGRFELKIFPIPAHGSRRVTVAYTQTIDPSNGVRRYVYPLAHDANGSTRVEQFDVDVQVLGHDRTQGVRARGYSLTEDAALTAQSPAGAARMAFSQSAFVPAGDLVVEYALADEGPGVTAWAFQPANAAPGVNPSAVAENTARSRVEPSAPSPAAAAGIAAPSGGPEPAFVALSVRPQLPRWTDARPRDYALVLDASRSMVGERFARARRLAVSMIAEMDPRDRVAVLACDTTCRTSPGGLRFAGAETVRAIEQFLATEDAHGASDLVAQMREAASLLGGSRDRDARVVYLGDGAATAGWRAPDAIESEVGDAVNSSARGTAGRTTVTAVALGSDADTHALRALARAGGGAVVPFAPGESVASSALAVLEATYGVTLRDPQIELPAGLTATAPSRLATVRAGGEMLVVARMASAEVRGDVVLRGTVAGEPFEARYPVTVQASTAPGNAFVTRLYAATKIAELEEQGTPEARAEAVGLSQRFHVASRYTSLLVLESDAMYRAFGVERNRDSSVAWTGDEGAVATRSLDRAAVQIAARAAAVQSALGASLANAQAPAAEPVREVAAAAAAGQRDMPAPAQGPVLQGAVPMGGLEATPAAEESQQPSAVGTLGLVGHGEAASGAGAGFGIGRGMSGDLQANRAGGASNAAGDDEDVGGIDANTASVERAEQAPALDALARGRISAEASALANADSGRNAVSSGARLMEPPATPPMGGAVRTDGPMRRAVATPTATPAARPRVTVNRPGATTTMVPLADPFGMEPRGPGRWMRRVWVRRAAINASRGAQADALAASGRVSQARAALLAMPDSRTRHLELYRWLAVAGDTDEAADVAMRWTTRDALDPDALVRLADVAARRGERDKAVRILAGTVDVRPGEAERLERMVQLFDRGGDATRACAFRVSLAELSARDVERVASAVRCERALGHTAAAERLLSRVNDEVIRRRIEQRVGAVAATAADETPRGDLTVRASWDAATDLDLAVVDGRGVRISWMGGRARGIGVRDVRSLTSEALGVARIGTGDYFIEVARSAMDGRPVRGTVEVSALDQRQRFSFVLLPGQSVARVGRVVLTRESRLEAM